MKEKDNFIKYQKAIIIILILCNVALIFSSYPYFPLFNTINYDLFWVTFWGIAFILIFSLFFKKCQKRVKSQAEDPKTYEDTMEEIKEKMLNKNIKELGEIKNEKENNSNN